MIITKSNILLGVTPSVLSGASSDNPANITNQDFSANYNFSRNFSSMSFGQTGVISYVAIAGTRFGNGSGVAVTDGGTTIFTKNNLVRPNCLVITFAPRAFLDLKINLDSRGTSSGSVAFIAAGDYLQVPNGGEQSGYSRSWLQRSKVITSQVNSMGAPIAQLKSRVPLKGTLNIPNSEVALSRGEWQNLLDFTQDNVFFIREIDDIEGVTGLNQRIDSSYVCFDAQDDTSAHGQTRLLDNLSLKFKVFNGL